MNTNMPCNDGVYLGSAFSVVVSLANTDDIIRSDDCPTPDYIQCCAPFNAENVSNDGQDDTYIAKGTFTDDEAAGDVVTEGQAPFDPLSGIYIQASAESIDLDLDNLIPSSPFSYESFWDNSQQSPPGGDKFARGDSFPE